MFIDVLYDFRGYLYHAWYASGLEFMIFTFFLVCLFDFGSAVLFFFYIIPFADS